MKKIPVGATVAHAYRFAFQNFLPVLGIVWLPWLVLAAAGFILGKTGLVVPGAGAHNLPVLAPTFLVALLLLCMQITGVTEYALGLKKGSPRFYFSLGKPVWRVIGAMLLLVLVILVCVVVMLIGGFIIGFLARLAHSAAITSLVALLAFVVGFCAYIYILLRFSFILVPSVIAEGRISLERTWTLTQGNFWRILFVFLAIVIPALAIEFVVVFKFLLVGMPIVPPNPTPDQLDAFRASLNVWQMANMARITHYWYIVEPLSLAFLTVFYGLSARAQALSYRALTEAESIPSLP
jgi:hypothetical protein